MIISNFDTEVNMTIENFKVNGVEFKYVQEIDDTEKYLRIKYPFDHTISFKRGKAYNITYTTTRKLIDMIGNTGVRDVENKTFNCGKCRLLAVERHVDMESCNTIVYVFKKIKNK